MPSKESHIRSTHLVSIFYFQSFLNFRFTNLSEFNTIPPPGGNIQKRTHTRMFSLPPVPAPLPYTFFLSPSSIFSSNKIRCKSSVNKTAKIKLYQGLSLSHILIANLTSPSGYSKQNSSLNSSAQIKITSVSPKLPYLNKEHLLCHSLKPNPPENS